MLKKKSSALILNSRNELLVVKKKKNTSHFILPGGKVETNETAVEALYREVIEELGVQVVWHALEDIFIVQSQFEDYEMETHLYSVKVQGTPVPQNEILEIKWISLNTERKDLAAGITNHAIPLLKSRSENVNEF